MEVVDVLPQLRDPAPGFLCKDLNDRQNPQQYRVALAHTTIDFGDADVTQLTELPSIPSVLQLRAVVGDGRGLGLFVTKKGSHHGCEDDAMAEQARMGSIIILPPSQWVRLKEELATWQFDGVEAAFHGLPYSFDDILVFAQINFTPDLWFLILRGPMAGAICCWTHDGDSVMDRAWAADIRDWGRRVWEELPDVFGGIIRFNAEASLDVAPLHAQLYPEKYLSDIGN